MPDLLIRIRSILEDHWSLEERFTWEHGMSSVSCKRHLAFMPCWDRGTVQKRPALDFCSFAIGLQNVSFRGEILSVSDERAKNFISGQRSQEVACDIVPTYFMTARSPELNPANFSNNSVLLTPACQSDCFN